MTDNPQRRGHSSHTCPNCDYTDDICPTGTVCPECGCCEHGWIDGCPCEAGECGCFDVRMSDDDG